MDDGPSLRTWRAALVPLWGLLFRQDPKVSFALFILVSNSSWVVWFGVDLLVFGVLDVGRQYDCLEIAACRCQCCSWVFHDRRWTFPPFHSHLSMPIFLDHRGRSFIAERSEIGVVTYAVQVYTPWACLKKKTLPHGGLHKRRRPETRPEGGAQSVWYAGSICHRWPGRRAKRGPRQSRRFWFHTSNASCSDQWVETINGQVNGEGLRDPCGERGRKSSANRQKATNFLLDTKQGTKEKVKKKGPRLEVTDKDEYDSLDRSAIERSVEDSALEGQDGYDRVEGRDSTRQTPVAQPESKRSKDKAMVRDNVDLVEKGPGNVSPMDADRRPISSLIPGRAGKKKVTKKAAELETSDQDLENYDELDRSEAVVSPAQTRIALQPIDNCQKRVEKTWGCGESVKVTNLIAFGEEKAIYDREDSLGLESSNVRALQASIAALIVVCQHFGSPFSSCQRWPSALLWLLLWHCTSWWHRHPVGTTICSFALIAQTLKKQQKEIQVRVPMPVKHHKFFYFVSNAHLI